MSDPVHQDFRPGDVRHSLADVGKAKKMLDYNPSYSVRDGLDEAAQWYVHKLAPQS
jgi:UDP-N-acetylglucosamine 4-epimerase